MIEKEYYYACTLPIGIITIVGTTDYITRINFGISYSDLAENKITDLYNQTAIQLQAYFSGERHLFDIPINPKGTVFQRSVWNALLSIPYWETKCYSQNCLDCR